MGSQARDVGTLQTPDRTETSGDPSTIRNAGTLGSLKCSTGDPPIRKLPLLGTGPDSKRESRQASTEQRPTLLRQPGEAMVGEKLRTWSFVDLLGRSFQSAAPSRLDSLDGSRVCGIVDRPHCTSGSQVNLTAGWAPASGAGGATDRHAAENRGEHLRRIN